MSANVSPQSLASLVDSTIGAMLIGSMASAVLYGLTLYQGVRYYELAPRDVAFLKILVPSLLILETFHTVCALEGSYYYTVTNYSNPESIRRVHMAIKLVIPTTGLTTVLCQCFYARRVYLFGSRHRKTLVIAGLFCLAKIGFCLMIAAKAFVSSSLEIIEQYSWTVSGSYGCSIAVDGLLTGTLIYELLGSRTGFKRTDDLVETLALYTMNTGLLTSVVGVVVFILALAKPSTLLWASISLVGNKLYANAVLAVLNSRRSLASPCMGGESELEMETMGAQLRRRTLTELGAPQIPVPLPSIASSSASEARDFAVHNKVTIVLNSDSRSRSTAAYSEETISEARKAYVDSM